jgi:hypothetical protein
VKTAKKNREVQGLLLNSGTKNKNNRGWLICYLR